MGTFGIYGVNIGLDLEVVVAENTGLGDLLWPINPRMVTIKNVLL